MPRRRFFFVTIVGGAHARCSVSQRGEKPADDAGVLGEGARNGPRQREAGAVFCLLRFCFWMGGGGVGVGG